MTLAPRGSIFAGAALALASCMQPTIAPEPNVTNAWIDEPPTRGHGPYTSGLLVRRGNCLIIENVDGALLPICPEGTKIGERTVETPNLRGQRPLLVGRRAGIHGRYLIPNPAVSSDGAGCAPRAFRVERANRVYIADKPVEAAADADAVVVAEVLEVNLTDSLPDQLLTTIRVRVLNVLSGKATLGTTLKLRHAGGRAATGEWLGPAGDPIVAPHSGSRLKPGDQLLLFVNADLYRQQAEGRGGHPVAGYTVGSINPIVNGRIEGGSGVLPDTIAELKELLRRR